MNLFSVHFNDDADIDFIQSLLLEIAAQPGVDLVMYEPSLVTADLPAAPELESGE